MSWRKLLKARSSMLIVGLTILGVASLISVVHVQPASAGGGVGSGGEATGGTGGYQSTDGYGWYLYSVSSGGPNDGFRDGTSWSTVQAACSGYSPQVAVFVIRSHDHTKYKGYNYPGWNNATYYLTSAGFISVATAKAGFDALPASLKTGFTWASNVAWYCYGTLPPPSVWTMSGRTTASTSSAHPGQSFTFLHYVKNDGPNTTNKSITADTQVSGGGTAKSEVNQGTFTAGQEKHVFTDTTSFPNSAATKHGDQICERVGYKPTSSTNSAHSYGAWKCVTAVVDWTVNGLVQPHDAAGNSVTTAQPLTRVYFDYSIVKTGPDTAYNVKWTADPPGLNKTATQNFSATTKVLASTPSSTPSSYADIPITAKNGDPVCKTMTWTPVSSTNSATGTKQGCITVKFSYTLTPVVTVNPASVVQAGQDFTFSYNINNSTPYTTNNTNWTIRQTVTSPAGIVTNSTIQSGTNSFTGNWSPRSPDTVTNNFPVGSTICRYLSVNSSTDQPNVPAENGTCILIAASPYVSIVGGNVWAGGSTTSPYAGAATITGVSSSVFGSFGDYGAFATGPISSFGTAGQLGVVTTPMGEGTMLTFANQGSLGSFSSSHQIRSFPTVPPSLSGLNGSKQVPTASGEYYVNSTGLQLQATDMPAGNHVVIYAPSSTVVVEGNITFKGAGTSTLTRFLDVPSLTIYAQDIVVKGAVKEIAGNFYATKTFTTCDEGPRSTADNSNLGLRNAITSAAGAACNNPLVINGTVTVATPQASGGRLALNRSRGGTQQGESAEVIRMRPESFLTDYEGGNTPGGMLLTTINESELPPRY